MITSKTVITSKIRQALKDGLSNNPDRLYSEQLALVKCVLILAEAVDRIEGSLKEAEQ